MMCKKSHEFHVFRMFNDYLNKHKRVLPNKKNDTNFFSLGILHESKYRHFRGKIVKDFKSTYYNDNPNTKGKKKKKN